ncbi:MAG: DUF2924 domain-containing protein [Pirellulales bacterium]
MDLDIETTIAQLSRASVPELRSQYLELFGEMPNSHNRTWLVRRLAWRIQMLQEGDLSQRAIDRAGELANEADLRVAAPSRRTTGGSPSIGGRDRRLPPPGSLLTRAYKGKQVQVQVLAEGFEFAGRVYGSLSAVATAISGQHANGYLFFGLVPRRRNTPAAKRRTP